MPLFYRKPKVRLPLGKTAARPEAVTFKLSTYLDTTKLPTVPKIIGHYGLLPVDDGMLGNDNYGDCVWAGAAHETMLWTLEAGKLAAFSTDGVLSDYSAVTGFKKSDPNTDQGTDMKDAASYRRKTGVIDAAGKRHKVDAYLGLKVGNMTELNQALYLFGAVGVGIQFPESAMTQFNNGKAWTVVPGAKIEGGHYVPLVGLNGKYYVITWGKLQPVSAAFLKKYMDEAIAYVSAEQLKNGKTLDGFDLTTLLADLKAL
jgi:hypothetical protein